MSHNNWYTPPEIIERAVRLMGGPIDFDPYSCEEANKYVNARRYYTAEDDGLTRRWPKAERVWCNPPYTRDAGTAGPFLDRLWSMRNQWHQATILTNASTSAAWWQRMAQRADAVCLLADRIRFIDGTGKHDGASPRYANSIFYVGPRAANMRMIFAGKGLVCRT